MRGLDMRKHAKTLNHLKQPVYYDLYAVANHYGDLDGGHYTAYCYNPVFGKWYNFNDHSCEEIPEEKRLCSSKIVTENAYMLFYRIRD